MRPKESAPAEKRLEFEDLLIELGKLLPNRQGQRKNKSENEFAEIREKFLAGDDRDFAEEAARLSETNAGVLSRFATALRADEFPATTVATYMRHVVSALSWAASASRRSHADTPSFPAAFSHRFHVSAGTRIVFRTAGSFPSVGLPIFVFFGVVFMLSVLS